MNKETFLNYWVDHLPNPERPVRALIVCNDGFTVSCQNHFASYAKSNNWKRLCEITDMELGLPSQPDNLIKDYQCDPEHTAPTQDIYGYVPIEIVVKLINKHGGIKNFN